MKIPDGFTATNDRRMFLDAQGRVCVFEVKDFQQYLSRKRLTVEEVTAMPYEKKTEFFLKFKHGGSDPGSNKAIEDTKLFLHGRDKDMALDDIPPDLRTHIKLEREAMSYFQAIKQLIGLGGTAKPRGGPVEQPTNWND